MGPSTTNVKATLRDLRRTPRYLKGLADGLTEQQLRRPPGPGEWSVHEVVAHLRGCADVRAGWIATMLAAEAPTIRYRSPRTGMKKTGYERQDFAAFLRDFERQRAGLVKTLASLDLDIWSRSATFTGTAPGWIQTVFDVATGLLTHEHAHFAQIEATASAVRASGGKGA